MVIRRPQKDGDCRETEAAQGRNLGGRERGMVRKAKDRADQAQPCLVPDFSEDHTMMVAYSAMPTSSMRQAPLVRSASIHR